MAFGGSWLCTIPLACLASIVLNLNLAGQTAAVVLGYMASGTVNAYYLFRSDWEQLSQDIIEAHELDEAETGDEDDDDAGSVKSQEVSKEATSKGLTTP